MLVISTPYVESARYYIENGVNGIIIEPELKQLTTQMEWCINNPDKVFKMGQYARVTAQKATASNIAKEFCDIIQKYLNC